MTVRSYDLSFILREVKVPTSSSKRNLKFAEGDKKTKSAAPVTQGDAFMLVSKTNLQPKVNLRPVAY
jgi:hypothetical protein